MRLNFTTGNGKKFLPVLHTSTGLHAGDIDHAVQNVQVALENGADGCLLINHNYPRQHPSVFWYLILEVRKNFPSAYIGVNFLNAYDVAHLSYMASGAKWSMDALWTDQLFPNKKFLSKSRDIFGGVDFKYQENSLSREEQVKLAKSYTTVAMTSGPATGYPPTPAKCRDIKQLLGGHPLGVASGVNQKNVFGLLPFVDVFLVASSIVSNGDWGENFEAKKLKDLADAIHSY